MVGKTGAGKKTLSPQDVRMEFCFWYAWYSRTERDS